ncbi:MAG: aminotransferase class V-fold PLP-dependent enzyme [bacterium]
MDEQRITSLRRLFPVTERWTWFNHACTGPMPATTVQAVADFVERAARDGEVPYAEAEAMADACRDRLARLLHVPPDSVAFTGSTTAGLLIAVGAVDWRAGDNVVLMEDDFPTVTAPFRFLLPEVEKRFTNSAALVEGPEAVFSLVDRRTRMVAVSWVHFLTGRRFDVRAIARFCRERGVVSVIDAIQGIGAVDCDWTAVDADFVVGHGAKWLLAPQGSGMMHVRPATLAGLRPTHHGWLSADWRDFNDIFSARPLKPGAARFEAGTKNYLGICGLGASLELWDQLGIAAIEARLRALDTRLRSGLEAAGFEIITPAEPERSGGIVTCRKPGACSASLHAFLKAGGFVCALRENLLRVAPHFYNTEAEVDRFVARAADPAALTAPPSDCKT